MGITTCSEINILIDNQQVQDILETLNKFNGKTTKIPYLIIYE